MNIDLFESLLQQMEGETIDFKMTHYSLSDEKSMISFVKDVVSMANTPRDTSSYIVLGVKKYVDGTFHLNGVSSHIDGADLQQQFIDKVAPIPVFKYHIVNYMNLQFGVIEIPPDRVGPCLPLLDIPKRHNNQDPPKLKQWAIYFRRDSKNDEAKLPEDIAKILNWFGKISPNVVYTNDDPAWERFVESVYDFSPDRYFILISHPCQDQDSSALANLGHIPWISVIDFDVESDVNGLLAHAKGTVEVYRSVHRITHLDYATFNLRTGVYWYFARGLIGRLDSLETGDWIKWKKTLGAGLRNYVLRLASACAPQLVNCVVIWYGNTLIRHLQSTLELILESFGESAKIVIATDNPSDLRSIASDYDAELCVIPLHQLSSGIAAKFHRVYGYDQNISLPSHSGAPVELSQQDYNWFEEELEILHLIRGLTPDIDVEIGMDFLRGGQITWYDLSLSYDVERDVYDRLQRQIMVDLQRRRTSRINLYHAPGAGGTTVARRILWQVHRKFPCAILKRINPADTAERLFRISSITEQPILLLIDGSDIAEREVDELYDVLRSRQIPVIVFQVLRRFSAQQERERSFYLKAELSPSEANRFAHIYARSMKERQRDIEVLLSSTDDRHRTAFYFGLYTFQKDFKGLDSFVSARTKILSPEQCKVLGFLALAHHYAQKSLPAQAFASIVGLPASRSVSFFDLLPKVTLELLVEEKRGVWRTTHNLIAEEILQHLLWPSSSDRRNWRQNLSAWSIEFIQFCRGKNPVLSADMLEVARRVFIYRDNSELLGTERSGSKHFSQLITDIFSPNGALEVLLELAKTYPEEAHFHAHLGRFYCNKLQRYDKAVESIERAIYLDENDSLLHHMKGMILRYQIYELISNNGDIDEIISIAKSATGAFVRSREKNPDNEHGYISEVQMLIEILDYSGRKHPRGINGYLVSKDANPYLRDSFAYCEDLLERVRRNREGQGPSSYEEECRAKLDILYGRYDQALQTWNNLLNRKDAFKPSVSRQIVWTYLAKASRSWANVTVKQAQRMVELLESSLQQEPYNDTTIRLWIQAVRRLSYPPSLDSMIELVSYWRTNSGSLDASYYLYVLNAIQAIEGSSLSRDAAIRFADETRSRANIRRNRIKSFEWLGYGRGITQLVHHSQLGDWDVNQDFWSNTHPLSQTSGRIARIDSEQAGRVELKSGLFAFFVPVKGGYRRNYSENQLVTFYLGFSYDGLRAWNVKNLVK